MLLMRLCATARQAAARQTESSPTFKRSANAMVTSSIAAVKVGNTTLTSRTHVLPSPMPGTASSISAVCTCAWSFAYHRRVVHMMKVARAATACAVNVQSVSASLQHMLCFMSSLLHWPSRMAEWRE